MRRCLASRFLASLNDHVSCALGGLRGLAGKVVREHMETQAVELGVNPVLANSALTDGLR